MKEIGIKNSFLFGIGVLIIASLFSCKGEDVFYQTFQEIEKNSWDSKEKLEFEFDIKDTNSIYNFYFNLRNTSAYEFSNIYIFWKLNAPNGKIKTDTSEFILAKPNGQWLGTSASGTVIENSMLFLKKKLPAEGKYTFSFVHGMRREKLEAIKDIGLKIVKENE